MKKESISSENRPW